MWAYIVRRILLTIPTVLGIVALTFVLFSLVSKDPARAYAGKQASERQLEEIRHKMGLDKPRFLNLEAAKSRSIGAAFDSQFFDILTFRLHGSMRYEKSVWELLWIKGRVSLAIQLPAFVISLGLELSLALYVAFRRGKTSDYVVTTLSVIGISVPTMAVYIIFQWIFGARLRIFPVAGWESGFWHAIPFAALPIICAVFTTVGGGVRFYRTVVLDEINSDYVRTARAKGLSSSQVLLTHVLRNVMIPVITNTIITLPFLIFGALILESLFQIPGLGGLLVQSIFNQDRSVVLGITYVTALTYCIMLMVNDILYTLADPRVRLQ